ncbi:hypothetical protein NE237_017468 [Protea cynaroides]|uniref:PARP catalytic domain-containing protein n=1 Tax=Protea cynaroides TaxID=273540 RepID=A0A9Q0K818_9MAGN|nr:hypothetical protein NE237_017468 [Protea cynaroides]
MTFRNSSSISYLLTYEAKLWYHSPTSWNHYRKYFKRFGSNEGGCKTIDELLQRWLDLPQCTHSLPKWRWNRIFPYLSVVAPSLYYHIHDSSREHHVHFLIKLTHEV